MGNLHIPGQTHQHGGNLTLKLGEEFLLHGLVG